MKQKLCFNWIEKSCPLKKHISFNFFCLIYGQVTKKVLISCFKRKEQYYSTINSYLRVTTRADYRLTQLNDSLH